MRKKKVELGINSLACSAELRFSEYPILLQDIVETKGNNNVNNNPGDFVIKLKPVGQQVRARRFQGDTAGHDEDEFHQLHAYRRFARIVIVKGPVTVYRKIKYRTDDATDSDRDGKVNVEYFRAKDHHQVIEDPACKR